MASHKVSTNERTHDAPIDRRRDGTEHPNRPRPGTGPHPAKAQGAPPHLHAREHPRAVNAKGIAQ
jgi:hypothetical protein